MTIIITESGEVYYQYMDLSLSQSNVTEDIPLHHYPDILSILYSPRLLDAVERLIGPEIYSNLVQDVRIKPSERLIPENIRNVGLVTAT